jgi:hypothetical protein
MIYVISYCEYLHVVQHYLANLLHTYNMLYVNIYMHPSVANDWQHIATYITTALFDIKNIFFMAKSITTVLILTSILII